MRAIDADALKDVIQQHDYPLANWLNSVDNGMFTLGIFQAIDEQPTVSPDEVRGVGKWIDMGDFEQCSVCKGTHLKEFNSMYGKATWIKTPYCHNCGARMKGAEDKS